ncbi:hypothetical protein [Streptomyces venezuelae]|uniref:hypothetical protein n=1 Tax=Streptomyces venezuelae TaxID=54571 RepID=UPI00278C10F9|nr:hypothetical protein [Streptomyces venezuelae]
MGDQNDAMAEEGDAGAVGHEAFPQLDVGDPAFADAGVVGGGDPLGDCVLVFAKGSGEADQRRQAAAGEVVQPVRKGCRVAVVEHGREPADQIVSSPEFRAVLQEPGQTVVDVEVVSVRVGGDPAGRFTR